jgi:hypothetical protein
LHRFSSSTPDIKFASGIKINLQIHSTMVAECSDTERRKSIRFPKNAIEKVEETGQALEKQAQA